MIDLSTYTLRPSMGSPRIDVTCQRCRGLVRDGNLGGHASVADVMAAVEAHEKRKHTTPVVQAAGMAPV